MTSLNTRGNTIFPPKSWMKTRGRDTTVMVLDTGCRSPLPIQVREQRSFAGGFNPNNHCDHMVKILAANTPTEVGVAPECNVLSAQVLGTGSPCTGILKGLQWAVAASVDVVLMSWVASRPCPGTVTLMQELDRKGVILVGAFQTEHMWPHSEPFVVSVGTDDIRGDVNLVAPGEVLTIDETGEAHAVCGTSTAAAMVAGVAACAKSFNSKLNRESFMATLMRNASKPIAGQTNT